MAALTELVSIIVPCYNAARFLPSALDSALAQTAPNVEILVIDDGSTDDSVSVAQRYVDRHGGRVRLDVGPNGGPSAARNRGIALARGTYIQLLDSDDLLLPTKVADGLSAARAGVIPFSGLRTFGGPGASRTSRLSRLLRDEDPVFDPTKPLVTALTFEIQTNQPLFETSLLRSVGGFRPGMRWLEDIDLNLRLALAGARYEPIPVVGVLLRDHQTPGRQRLARGAAIGRIEGERAMIASVREAGRLDGELLGIFADRLAYAGRQAWLAGEIDAARDAFALARGLAERPKPTRVPLYNALSGAIGLERTERLVGRLSHLRSALSSGVLSR